MITTNTGAKKLESSDNWREIFPNSTLGTAGAHNASVDAADRIQPEIAPIINGKQCALGAAKDDYVLLRNSTITGKSDGAYIAAKAIPANTDIDSTYLGNAITGGISNSINSNIAQQVIYEDYSKSISYASSASAGDRYSHEGFDVKKTGYTPVCTHIIDFDSSKGLILNTSMSIGGTYATCYLDSFALRNITGGSGSMDVRVRVVYIKT